MNVRRLAYLPVAAVLGLFWFSTLALFPPTRKTFTQPGYWNLGLEAWEVAAVMVVTSVALACSFKRSIAKAQARGAQLWLALVLPLIGSLVFSFGMVALAASTGRIPELSSAGRVAGVLLQVAMTVLYFTVTLLPLVLPLGLLSQAIMHKLAGDPAAGG